jgi:pimeloyl-ACP methyl ester carboxylesterase
MSHAQESAASPELLAPTRIPEQVAAKEGWVPVAGARLWYGDTGGDGPAIVLVPPATGSGLIWGYQQPAFAKAGYRVIGYSRKHHAKSEVTAEDEIESDVDDLHRLAQALKLDKFHAVGSAAGGGIVMQYAVKHPQTLQSMTIACSLGSVQDKEFREACAALRPTGFSNLPPEFRELGPAYRAANPEGTRRWIELARIIHGGVKFLSLQVRLRS